MLATVTALVLLNNLTFRVSHRVDMENALLHLAESDQIP